MSWDSDPEEFVDEVEIFAKQEKAKVAVGVLSDIVIRSPVDTGRFRGNNQVSIKAASSSYEYSKKDKTGSNTLGDGAVGIPKAGAWDAIYIQNNLPYGDKLEDGFSPQAPGGVYKLAFEAAKRKLGK